MAVDQAAGGGSSWALFDFQEGGHNRVHEWAVVTLNKYHRIMLNNRLNLLRSEGLKLLGTNKLTRGEHGYGKLLKLKIKGQVQYRVLLCRGTRDPKREFTLLNGGEERDNNLPLGVWRTADDRRERLVRSDHQLRCDHEPVDPRA